MRTYDAEGSYAVLRSQLGTVGYDGSAQSFRQVQSLEMIAYAKYVECREGGEMLSKIPTSSDETVSCMASSVSWGISTLGVRRTWIQERAN